MTFEIEDSVVIGDGRSSVTLTPAGTRSLGFPTKIDPAAGPIRGTVVDDTAGSCARVHRELAHLYTSFSVPAQLQSCEHSSRELAAPRTGSTEIRVASFGSHCPMTKLEYEFELDQPYLPRIIKRIERLFLTWENKGIEPP